MSLVEHSGAWQPATKQLRAAFPHTFSKPQLELQPLGKLKVANLNFLNLISESPPNHIPSFTFSV